MPSALEGHGPRVCSRELRLWFVTQEMIGNPLKLTTPTVYPKVLAFFSKHLFQTLSHFFV